MNINIKLILSACLGGAFVVLGAEEKAPTAETTAKLQVLEAVYSVSAFRKAACNNAAEAVKTMFNARASMRWQRISTEYSPEQLDDFFMGTVVLGSMNKEYAGLYNPWWDTILLLKSSGLPQVPKVDSFCFVSGEKFRGETAKPSAGLPVNLEGTVPLARPYAVDIWSLVSRTRKEYEGKFEAAPAVAFMRLQAVDAADTERIQIRSGVRLKLVKKFLHDKSMQREAHRICRYLTSGNEDRMLRYFEDGGADFVKKFAELPGVFRQNFIPYCYFPGKEGVLFVFFNKEMPRIMVTVTYPRKGIRRIMEWYDLQASDAFLDVWNQRGGDAK